MSCCGTTEQVRATEGTLNTLNFNEEKNELRLRKSKSKNSEYFYSPRKQNKHTLRYSFPSEDTRNDLVQIYFDLLEILVSVSILSNFM